jgi:dihydrofolate reductase
MALLKARGDTNWLAKDDPEQWADVFGMLQSVDLLLLGRVMWPGYGDFWKRALTDPSASPNQVAYAKLAEKTKHLVFSNTLKDAGWENATIVNGSVAEKVARLKKEKGKDIQVVGGAKFAATIIGAGCG